jgi:pimeloyl-ACP methyl ester carboxylesterase
MSEFVYSTEGFTRHVTTVNGVDCVWYEIGAGDPVVYFHGGGTYHGFEWARDWAADVRVILPYHPNFGESGDADFKSIGAYVWHYRSFFAAIGLERFDLVGTSTGGHFAARYAIAEPAQVRKLVLVSPAGLQSPRAPLPDWVKIPHAETPRLLVSDVRFLAPYWPAEPSEAWRTLRTRELTAVLAARDGEEAGEDFLRANLPKLFLPTQLIWGDADGVLPIPLLDEWQACIADAETVVIPGGGHLLLDEFPAARQAALDFLLG